MDTNTTGGMTRRWTLNEARAHSRGQTSKARQAEENTTTMASRLLRRPARQLLLRSNAASNVVSLSPTTRAFHASAPRQAAGLDAILYLPHEMMSLVHTQVPWYAAIPLSAFLLRAALVTSFGTWARSLMARYIGLQPLRQAIARTKRDEVLKEMHKQGGARSPKEAQIRAMAGVKEVVNELDSRWKVTLKGQVAWTLIQIPIFFTMAEVIRKMCGARDGLLALTASSVRSMKDWVTGGTQAATNAAASPSALEASGALSAPDALSIANALNNATATTNVDALSTLATSPLFEPTLATEGMLWFPNLITPDPFLPFIVSGLMFSNIYFSKNAPTSEKNWPNLIRRTLLCVSLLIGPLCQNLPAGLMLYWAGSTTSVMAWNKWLDWKYPAPADFTACKRPLQMPPTIKTKAAVRKM
jgi:inner membrane protein COX18